MCQLGKMISQKISSSSDCLFKKRRRDIWKHWTRAGNQSFVVKHYLTVKEEVYHEDGPGSISHPGFILFSFSGQREEKPKSRPRQDAFLQSVSFSCSLRDVWRSQVSRSKGSGSREESTCWKGWGFGIRSGGEASSQTAVVPRSKKKQGSLRPSSFKLLKHGGFSLLKDRQPGTYGPGVRSCSKILTRLKISCGLNFNFKMELTQICICRFWCLLWLWLGSSSKKFPLKF